MDIPNMPATLKMIPYSQRPTFLGILWERPANIDVDHYELYISPKAIGNNEVGTLLSGAKAGEGVLKVDLAAGCTCVVDNRSPQGQRVYYTVLAVDKTGNFHQPNFQVNDTGNLKLVDPTYLKEPYAPTSLRFVPYGQKPDGIGVSWVAPNGDWASYRVVVVTGKTISRPEDFEKLFAGQLDFVKLYEVPADAREAVDDATPQGTRNYYAVVAVDRKGNMVEVEKFQAAEAAQAKLKAPVRLSGRSPAAPAPSSKAGEAGPGPSVSSLPPPGTGQMAAPSQPKPPPPPYPQCDIRPRAPGDQPKLAPGARYPARLSTIPSTQHIYGTRIRIKEPRTDLTHRILVSTKSIGKPEDALEGRLDHVRVYDIAPGVQEVIDNTVAPYTRCYYAVLGRDAEGNHIELPFEVKPPNDYKVGGARFLDPSKGWPLPTVDDDWLLKTTEKGVEAVPEPPSGSMKASIGPYVNQVWEGTRIRIKGAKKEYTRYQLLIGGNYLYKEHVLDAVLGRSSFIKAHDIPVDALELIDNLTPTGAKVYIGLIGWDKDGNGYNVELDFPSTQYAEFKSPRFVDPKDLARVKAAADETIAQGRQLIASIGTDKQALYSGGPSAIEGAVALGRKARLVYPMYEDVERFKEEVLDKNGWLFQARSQHESEELLRKAATDLKGEDPPYASPHYGSVEESLKALRAKQDESRGLLQKHIEQAPWSKGSKWYPERTKQFDDNEAKARAIEEHMAKLKVRDAKAREHYEKARVAHKEARYDDAIEQYRKVMEVKPEWDTKGDIQAALDDKEFDGQVAAAGKSLPKFKAIFDDWMGRGKDTYAWRALGTAFSQLQDKDSFLLYGRQLIAHGHHRDAVLLYREVHEAKLELLNGIFGPDKVRAVGTQMEDAYSEMRRIEGEIRDLERAKSDLDSEMFKIMGHGYTDYRTRLQNDIDRTRNSIERDQERIQDLYRRMALLLQDMFGT